ncbi:MAG TPA: hypothetical protein VNW53_06990 [Phenylobacterium sp.]|jgi:hypothetical protein|uniref:beta strand repeat-containing protein n=1 Tax=Phenylobacterium sp. TaxID=1871053 RepID=UPI002BFC93D7|nr:hypothetical protein [Phenylobacterium sp.]HXA38726.1 hypothetical protein [Phenylobacterium sp.]
MVSSLATQSYVLGLFNTSNTNSNGIISLDLSSLITGQSSAAATTPAAPVAPAPPWNTSETATQSTANVQKALAGQPLISASTAKLSGPDPTGDYQKLFSLYQGLQSLQDIANQAAKTSLSPQDRSQLANAFSTGMAQLSTYVSSTAFAKLRLAEGADSTNVKSTLAVAAPATTYVTPPLTTSQTADVPAFDGNVQFNIAVTLNKNTTNIPIDLSNLGTAPRSISNVINYINQQLSAAGVQTRFASSRIPGQPQTITAGGTTVTLAPTADQFAMQINLGTSEQVSFSAPQTAGAVYVAQTVGNPNPDGDPTTNDGNTQAQLTKFQTDTTNVAAPPQIPGQANFSPGRVFADNLDPNVGTVHAMQVGSDGSVYMLADVTGTTNGQSIQGTQDVALLKYDSAGHLIYNRNLGASSTATGLGLAVSSTGQVAVVGSVTGALNGASDGPLNSGATGAFADQTDSFTTLYDSSGNEVWTARRGATLQDQATQVSFSADGSTVYVAGQAQGALPGGGAPIGGYDGYIEGFKTSATGAPQSIFTQTFGTTGADMTKGMVVSGNSLITASVEGGHAILRNFDISSGAPVLAATRDLGDLQGGTIAGLALNGSQVVVAGTTANGALSAGTITNAASGGTDAFAAQVNTNLSSSPTDAVAYYGGSGNDRATSLAVSNGQVWIGGQAGTDLPGQPAVGTKDGFIAQLNISTGQVVTSNRFTGKSSMTTPTAIAVDTSGSSVLDRLGLPKGTVGVDTSQQLTAQSSLRAGEQFTVAAGSGPATTITIDSNETLDSLATKIARATGSQATAKVSSSLTGAKQLSITPAYAGATITLGAGPTGKNALPTLGLAEGVLSLNTTNAKGVTSPADGKPTIYGLGLSTTLNLSNASQVSHAQSTINLAMGVVRKAYQDMVTAATPKTAAQTAAATGKTGTVPTYLTNELANLQAGLARLTGGNPAPSTSTFA